MNFRVTLLLLSFFAAYSCANNGKEEITNSIRKIKWQRAESYSTKENNYVFSGKVESAKDINLSFRVAGVIEQIAGKNGTFVKQGEVIATLDDRDYIEQLNATQAEYDAISGEVNRIVSLYKSESVSENDYKKAINGLKQITAKLNTHRNALNDTRLVAPFDGYIQKLYFDTNETVGAGMATVAFVGADELEVVVNIPYVNYIKQNMFKSATATIHQHANQVFSLKLIGISPKANLNQLHTARFAIETNKSTRLVAGMSVVVEMSYSEVSDNSVTLPLSAILEIDNRAHVWTLTENNRVKLSEVKISEVKRNGNVVVYSGVKIGDIVVTAGVNSLKEGMEVSPLEQTTTTNIGGIL